MKVQISYILTKNFMINVRIHILSIEFDMRTKLFIPWKEGNAVVVDIDTLEYGKKDTIEKEFENIKDAKIWVANILDLLSKCLKKIKNNKFAELPEPYICEIDGEYIKQI